MNWDEGPGRSQYPAEEQQTKVETLHIIKLRSSYRKKINH
jgi:hypothetical protein